MTTYRYLFADLVTNTVIAELPVTNVNFTSQLNSAGSFTGELLLSGIDATGLNVANATIPARTALFVDRNGTIVWGGIIWHRTWNSSTQKLMLNASEYESYYERRRITTTQVYNNTDQFAIVLNLLLGTMGVSNPPVTPSNTLYAAASGKLVNRTYYSYELKPVLQAIQDLSKQGIGVTGSYGFDYSIDCAYNALGSISITFNVASPMSGTRYSASNPSAPVFEFPSGNILEYEYSEDGTITANKVYGVGAGSNEGMAITTSNDATKTSAGWPVLEDSISFTDVWDTTLLQNLSDGQLATTTNPPTNIKVIAAPYIDPVLGSFSIGDDIRVRIRDDRFPTGLDAIYRLVALSVTPGENGPERMTLTLTLPTTTY